MSAERVDSPHAGISHVRRWLARPPAKADRLRLVYRPSADTQQTIETWELHRVKPGLAQDVIDAVDDVAIASERDVACQLEYLDADGEVVQSRYVRRRYQGEVSPSTLTGSPQDQAAQAQRHLDGIMRQCMRAMADAHNTVLRMAEASMQMSERLSARLVQTEEEADAWRAKAIEVASREPRAEEETVQTLAEKQLEAIAPLALQAFLAPQAPTGGSDGKGKGQSQAGQEAAEKAGKSGE